MTRTLKRIFISLLAAAMCMAAVLFSACADGQDGEDGKDLDIYDVYYAVNEARAEEGLEELTFLEFIEEYFDYVTDQAVTSADTTAIMNYSLLSGVSVFTQFTTRSSWSYSTSEDVYVGSGVFVYVDKEAGDAYVVTNAHVVYDSSSTAADGICENVYLYLYGSDTYGVDYSVTTSGIDNVSGITPEYTEVIGVSLTYDIAVIKVTGSDIIKNSNAVAAKFSTDSNIYVGEDVYTVGNPMYEGLSLETGTISKDSEYISLDVDEDNVSESFRVFRMTTPINGGNSGGAVFNMSGEIIGIANATSLTEDNAVQGMCYALPANNVRRIVQSMIDAYEDSDTAYHYLTKALIGISTTINPTSTSAEYDADTGHTIITEEVLVYSVSSGSLAQSVLKANDVLISYSIGKMDGSTPSAAQSSRYSGFYIPENNDYLTDSRYCDTVAITRSYTTTEAMLSVRMGDTVELVIERNSKTYYMYFTFTDSANFTTYS